MREIISFDKDWKFYLGDIQADKAIWGFLKAGTHNQNGASKALDDTGWDKVNLPHDFMIGGYVTHSKEKWGTGNSIPAMDYIGNLHIARGSLDGNIAWYRKKFKVSSKGKRVYIKFDGIFRDSEIYVNDFLVGKHVSGYTGVIYDITDFLYDNDENAVAVRVDSRTAEGWFYEGGGIYRHVWLITTPLVSVGHYGVFVKSKVDLELDQTELTIETKVANNSDLKAEVAISHKIVDPDGMEYDLEEISVSIACKESKVTDHFVTIRKPLLWDIDTPNMYTLHTYLSNGDKVITEFGIRDMYFDQDKGFFLNGKNVKIKGVCCHQDHAGLGAALPDGMQYYRIQKLKEMGCNAYRSAHNPATDEILQACDRLGMLVMDENRLLSSSTEDLLQLEEMVLSARNHPSIFIWALGNEEVNIQFTDQGRKIANTMRNHVRRLDGTRPVTVAVCMWEAGKLGQTVGDPVKQGVIAPSVDVFGFNYFSEIWDAFHEAYPDKPLICTEDCSFSSTRGCRVTEDDKCHMSLTDKNKGSYRAGEKEWKVAADREYIAGTFIWTGFDYHGEPSPYSWPAVASQFGIMDLCGFPKDAYYYYKAWWSKEDVLYLCADGNMVWCLTNCDKVELFAGNRSFGILEVEKNGLLIWEDVQKTEGLSAIGYKNGKEAMRSELSGFEYPEEIIAEADYAYPEKDGTRTVVVNVQIVDGNKHMVEDADNMVTFSCPDNVTLLGIGNGDPSSHENAKQNYRRAFNGRLQAIFSVEGEAVINAEALNLKKAIVKL
ncbi:MAG: glycoside hydrolase family 2 TIM barrel-domain containing protein [Anaerocolumna sp.]